MLEVAFGFGLLLGRFGTLQAKVKLQRGSQESQQQLAYLGVLRTGPLPLDWVGLLGGHAAMVSVHQRACLAAPNGVKYHGLDPDRAVEGSGICWRVAFRVGKAGSL